MKFLVLLNNRSLLALLAIVLLILCSRLLGVDEHFSQEALKAQIYEHHPFGLLLFFILFAIGNFLHIPGTVFMLAAVFIYDRYTAMIIIYVGAILSCIFSFFCVRLISGSSKKGPEGLKNKRLQSLLNKVDKNPVFSVFLLRLLIQTSPLLNYLLPMTGVRFRDYLLGCLLGLPIPIAVTVMAAWYLNSKIILP